MVNWPFTPLENNLHIVDAEGVYLTTRDGQRIIDAAGGAIVVNIGHGRTEVSDVVARTTGHASYIVPPFLTDERIALIERLQRDWLPPSLTRVNLTCGGSEAVESAMQMAIKFHAAGGRREKHKIIGRSISYHGTTLATNAVGGHIARKKDLAHALPTYPSTLTPYPLRCPSSDPRGYYVDAFRRTLSDEGPDTIAAFLAEPIVGSSGGAIVPPDGYWEDIQAICREHDILLIMDEVMTGFGRTGLDFGYQHWGIEPDILVAGKGLAGGYAPLGGTYASETIGRAIESAGMSIMFHTFGAHSASCAAADVVLEILKREKLVERASEKGRTLSDLLEKKFSNHPHIAETRGRGLLQAVEIVRDRETLEPFDTEANLAYNVMFEALSRGVFVYAGGTGVVRDIVCLGPPFIVEDEELELIVESLAESIDSVIAKLA
jgi:adenosylmethionine-8-amino-7-oxononanoate aminotransferase